MTRKNENGLLKQTAAELSARLRRDILRGRLKPGTALPTQRELGKQYGVGETTASTAMARLAHEGLIERVRGRGSFVAHGLPAPRRKTMDCLRVRKPIGTAFQQFTLAFIDTFTHYVEQGGWKARWHSLSQQQGDRIEDLAVQFEDAYAVALSRGVAPELAGMLIRQGVPAVALLTPVGGEQGTQPAAYPQVTFDRRETGRVAVTHLIGLGHRRLAYCGISDDPVNESVSMMRQAGFLDGVRRHDLTAPPAWLLEVGHEAIKDLRRCLPALMHGRDRPEAIVCSTPYVAWVIETVALEMGMTVPGDLEIIACDTSAWADDAPVPITTVGPDIGQLAAGVLELIGQIHDGGLGDEATGKWNPILLPLHVTVRGSCGGDSVAIGEAVADRAETAQEISR